MILNVTFQLHVWILLACIAECSFSIYFSNAFDGTKTWTLEYVEKSRHKYNTSENDKIIWDTIQSNVMQLYF